MKYAYINAYVLTGEEDMKPEEGLAILTTDERIDAVVPVGDGYKGYVPVDLHGQYIMPGLINLHVFLPPTLCLPPLSATPG